MSRPTHSDHAGDRARQLRRETTIAEDRLWSRIRRNQLGVRFRRQVPIGRWIADFACFDPRIVIEVDGASHTDCDETVRTSAITSRGFLVVRFSNDRVRRDIDEVVHELHQAVESRRTSG